MPSDERDDPGIRVPPPLVYLLGLLLGVVLDRKIHVPFLPRGVARVLGWPACGRRNGAGGLVRSNDARRRHYYPHRQARIEPRLGRTIPLQPQPWLPSTGDALRWDSGSQERAVGHPSLAVGAVCDPARGDRARGALPGTHFRGGVPRLQGEVRRWV